MLRPIPGKMLKDSVVLRVPSGTDRWQNVTYEEYEIYNVHLQADNKATISVNNSEVTLTGTLFIDAIRSTPALNIDELNNRAHENGSTMRAIVSDYGGNVVGDFNVLIVDGVPNVPATTVHHWELGLA